MSSSVCPSAPVAPYLLLSDNDIRRAFRTHHHILDDSWVGPFARSIAAQVHLWAQRMNRAVVELDLSNRAVAPLYSDVSGHSAHLSAATLARLIEARMLGAACAKEPDSLPA